MGDAILAERLDRWVYGTEPLPIAQALENIGWSLDREDISEDPVQVSLGVSIRGNPPVVRAPRLNGAAWRAGVNAGDELLALDGVQIGSGLNTLLRRYDPEDTVELALFRDGHLKTLGVTLDPALADHEIIVYEDAAQSRSQMRRDWLGGMDEGDE